jgi:excinuclease ABC subunit A
VRGKKGNIYIIMEEKIIIKGAREHNLKNINVEIPRNKLVVLTGVSGSGKSSLAFDTIYAEGQRKYVESLSAYARQFLDQMEKPDVDEISGLSPAISIEQRKPGANPRSTVGTVTEIYDYLRLLFARAGTSYCYKCGKKIDSQAIEKMVDRILGLPAGTQIEVLSPIVRGRKGEYQDLFKLLRQDGYSKVRIDGKTYSLSEEVRLNKNRKHNIEVIIDRLSIKSENKSRLADSLETTLSLSNGLALIVTNQKSPGGWEKETLFSATFSCPQCGISYGEINPRIFSFNSPYGACPTCAGLGKNTEIDPDLVIPDKTKSIREGAIVPWQGGGRRIRSYYRWLLRMLFRECDVNPEIKFEKLTPEKQKAVLYGSGDGRFEGVIPNLERRFRETKSDYVKKQILGVMNFLPCPSCHGARLKKESLAIKIDDKSIVEVTAMSVTTGQRFFSNLKLAGEKKVIARDIINEISKRLSFLSEVGLNYLTLDRETSTLSSGESERIRLASQIGSGLVGVLYVLDEPSIGLHARDNQKLLNALVRLRDLGNTVLVVEHDETTIRSADHIIDLGPEAGNNGGWVVAEGKLDSIMSSPQSLTGKYLKGELQIKVPLRRRQPKGIFLEIRGARENNLKNIDVQIPIGVFTCVTGVSGSGKSTLVVDTLEKALSRILHQAKVSPGKYDSISGNEYIDKMIVIDQAPIGRTPRSNPATYIGVFTFIRELFSLVPEARARGYKLGRFSFNVRGGRCNACQGDGIIKIEMHFLPDVYVHCQTCGGKRYNRETLEVKYKGKSIADVLDMTIDTALDFFENIPAIKKKLETLSDVGLGYIRLEQSAPTLSGGEAQRVKLAAELSRRGSGKTLYILDEPTTGLHFADIEKLLGVLSRLVDAGNTVVVIEHNLDVIKTADYIIDLGPEGGDEGGEVVATGTPEEIAANGNSYTGKFLKKLI